MKKFSITLLSLFLSATIASAQVIKGDMNDDGVMDIGDVSESVNTVLGKRAIQYVQGGADPYMLDNSRVVGTWYKTKNDYFTLNTDGTTSYPGASTFEFYPYRGHLVFLNSEDNIVTHFNLVRKTENRMVFTTQQSSNYVTYYNFQPPMLVSEIRLNERRLFLAPGAFSQLTATVLPADADNKAVTWESSNTGVVKVVDNLVLAVGEGSAVITCTATDGSLVSTTCNVTVRKNAEPQYVDLGLPSGVLWATCNIGADKPEDYGLYFAWGETVGYAMDEDHTFSWNTYKWCNGEDKMTKYSTSAAYWDPALGTSPDGKTILDPGDDAATANWGAGWRMPTFQEIKDLYDSKYTTTEWVTVNGVNGRKITSKSNGNSIFLPVAGYRNGTSLISEGSYGYWSSSLNTDDSNHAYCLNHNYFMGNDEYCRYYGLSVRAVRVASE